VQGIRQNGCQPRREVEEVSESGKKAGLREEIGRYLS